MAIAAPEPEPEQNDSRARGGGAAGGAYDRGYDRMKTALGDLPVVGTLRQCIATATGWRGVDEAGTVIEVRSWAQAHGYPVGPARIPSSNRIMKWENGRPVGVLVLQRKRRSSQKKKKPHDADVVGL
jgi:hypothetical protein